MFRFLGRQTISFLSYMGELAMLAAETAGAVVIAPIRWRLVVRQIAETGFRSQLVVVVTGSFTGAVFAVQTYSQFHRLGLDSAVGALVALSMLRELGPVLTGLMVAGRVGAASAAEIGTMKVTEQLDALRALGVQPVDYLVVPRMLAMLISMPLLVAECVGFGICAGYLVGTQVLGISAPYYLNNMLKYATGRDLKMTLIKGVFFGLVIVFIGCREGFQAREGAVGVGRAPTEAMVASSLTILVLNFFLSIALNLLLPYGH